ncbi:MAG: hypothetical protein AB8B55_14490 [Mariniblastus sp.]
MNLFVVDTQNALSESQAIYSENRIKYSLARFEHRINGATVHFTARADGKVRCEINVNIEGAGVVSVGRSSSSLENAVNRSVSAVEPKLACYVDWRAWFNADTFATLSIPVCEPMKRIMRLSEFKQHSTRQSNKQSIGEQRHRVSRKKHEALPTA